MTETKNLRPGWLSTFSGKTYEMDAPELVGMGNPSACPDFAREYPGAGPLRLDRVILEDTLAAKKEK